MQTFTTKSTLKHISFKNTKPYLAIYILLLSLTFIQVQAQVGIGTESPKAWLDMHSENQGALFPRVALKASNLETPVINPQGGSIEVSTIVYNTATDGTPPYQVTPGIHYWDGNSWIRLSSYKSTRAFYSGIGNVENDWSLQGNLITDDDFLGTINHKPVILKTHNKNLVRFSPLGSVLMGRDATGSENDAFAIGEKANASVPESFAFGPVSKATGHRSFAIGSNTIAAGENSFAFGNTAKTASGAANSIAIGQESTTNGAFSFAIGKKASTASGAANSVSIGENAKTVGAFSFAIGKEASTESDASRGFAIGYKAKSSANEAHALGHAALASGNNALAMGSSATSSANKTLAIGASAVADKVGATSIGHSSKSSGSYSTAIGYNAKTEQDFAIVLGDAYSGNSKVGIGTASPSSKLHLRVPNNSSSAALQIQDGSEGNGKVLTSDVDGKASWKSLNASQAIGQLSKSSNSILNSGIVNLTSTDVAINTNANGSNIQVTKTGWYRVSYDINLQKGNNTGAAKGYFFISNYGNERTGTRSYFSIQESHNLHLSFQKLIYLNEYTAVNLHSSTGNSDVTVLANGTNISVEFIQ